ncbi:MAG: FHA domain-containing protein, partial [Woeseiaceae bacterium]|nr:FHA domain-containing protein [Woeseiaceae bacterium]
MRCLIRFLTSNAAGDVEHSDKIVDAPVITIGRATDQILHLKDRRARLEHAQIAPKNGAIHISTGAMAGVTVNGRSQRDAKLSVGDVIEVGSNILRVIEAPEGADFAFTFELSTTAASEHLEQSWTTPTSGIGGFSKRKLSWSFAAIVLVAVFVIPLLLLDGWLTAGPVHSAHSS